MKRFLFCLIGSLCLLAGCQISPPSSNPSTVFPAPLRDVNETARMAIAIDGIQLNLAKEIYTQPSEKLYLDAKFPGIVRIKKAPLMWQELFESTPLKIENDCLTIDDRSTYCSTSDRKLKIFLNRVLVTSLHDKPITDGDTILISYGKETGVEIERQFSLLPPQP